MKSILYHLGKIAIGVSLANLRSQTPKKEDFIRQVLAAHPTVEKRKLKSLLERVWKEAFPKVEKSKKAAS